MSQVFDFSGATDFCPGGFMYQKPKESRPFLSLGNHVDVYFPLRKRSRITAPFVVSEPKKQPSIDILPEECLFEVFRRLPGGQERSNCACVSKRWLMLLTTISRDEICSSAQSVEPEIRSVSQKKDESAKPMEKKTEFVESDVEEYMESDNSHGFLSRCLEGKKANDVRLAAISVGTASRGGLGKLSIRGNKNTATNKLTNLGLKAISRGCPSLKVLSLWNVSSVSDEGLYEIATGCPSLEKLELYRCPSITDKAITAIAMNCPNLKSVTFESCSNIGNESLKALGSYCKNLNNITLKNCQLVGDQGIASLFSSAGQTIIKANLQALNVSDVSLAVIGHYGSAMIELTLNALNNVNEKGFWVMGKGQGLQKLKSLSITSCQGVSDSSLEVIAKGCPDLKTFCLQKCPRVSDNGVLLFVKTAASLESLKLDEIHRISQRGVFGVLANCGGKLKSLILSNCMSLCDVGYGFPSAPICSSLRSLTIHNCPGFGDLGLAMAGKLCPKLTHVDLSGLQGLTDSGVLPLVNSESGLVKVNLSGCVNITDNVVVEITKAHGETLEFLNLEGCRNVSDLSLIAIARNCSVLSEVDISQSGVTDYGVSVLGGAAHLSLRILSLSGCSLVSDESFPFLEILGRTLVGLNIQNCRGISYTTVNLLLEKLWRCDVLV